MQRSFTILTTALFVNSFGWGGGADLIFAGLTFLLFGIRGRRVEGSFFLSYFVI